MKILLLTCISLFFAVGGSAQTAPKRLIAESYYSKRTMSGPVLFSDSARYFYYDSVAGSRFDYNNLRYVNLSLIGSSPVADFLNIELPTNNIDSSEYLLIGFDTANYYSTRGIPLHGEGRNYMPDGRVRLVNNTSYYSSGVIYTGQRTVNVYSGGLLSKVFVTYYNAGSYDTSYIRSFLYDAAGRMTLDSLTSTMTGPRVRKTYTYYPTGAGYKTRTMELSGTSSSSLQIMGRTTKTYDAMGRVVTSFNEGYSNGFYPGGLDSFGYTAGVAGYTFLSEKTSATGVPEYEFRTVTNRINALGKKDSVTVSVYYNGNYDGGGTKRVYYDLDGDPTSVYEYSLDTAGKSTLFDYAIYYYNKPSPVIVARIQPVLAGISLAPNPTSGTLVLYYRQPQKSGPVTVAITNMAGQLVHSEQFIPQGTQSIINLRSEVPPGTYCLSITGAGIGQIYSAVFEKR